MQPRRVGDGDTHVGVAGGGHEAQERGPLGVNAQDCLCGGGYDAGGERGALGDLTVHEGGLNPRGDASAIGLHVHDQGIFVGEPSGQEHGYAGARRDRHLAWCGVEWASATIAVHAHDRSCGSRVGQDKNHVSTRCCCSRREPLGGTRGGAADGAETGEFAAALTCERQGGRDGSASACHARRGWVNRGG